MINPNTTDAEIIAYMEDCQSVFMWNAKRREVKRIRDFKWVATHLDSSGLIVKVLGKDIKREFTPRTIPIEGTDDALITLDSPVKEKT